MAEVGTEHEKLGREGGPSRSPGQGLQRSALASKLRNKGDQDRRNGGHEDQVYSRGEAVLARGPLAGTQSCPSFKDDDCSPSPTLSLVRSWISQEGTQLQETETLPNSGSYAWGLGLKLQVPRQVTHTRPTSIQKVWPDTQALSVSLLHPS